VSRRLALIILCVSCALGNSVMAEDQQVRDRPNILLITVDTFRPDHLGYDGYPHATSPNLDTLSEAGVFFKKAYTTSGWTAPGLISIHTSLYAPAHGVDVRGRSMDASITTLAEALRGAGYRAPDIFFLSDIPNFKNLGLEPWARRGQYVQDGDEILFRWLEEEATNSNQPFFLYYHYRDLHQPYAPGEEYEALFRQQAFGSRWNPMSWVRRFLAKEKIALVQREVMIPRNAMDFAPWDKGWIEAFYDGEIRRMDDRIFARLRRVLRQQGLEDNTVVVISADHGEELLEHGVIGHASTFKEGSLSEEVIRIPLIFWAPGRLPAGLVVDNEIVQAIDVMPTLLQMAGAEIPVRAQGRSLTPLFEGGELPGRPVFFETSAGGYTADLEQYASRTRAVRTERWKLLWRTPGDGIELFDVAADPTEDNEVSDTFPAVTDSLLALLTEWADSNPRIQTIADEPTLPIEASDPLSDERIDVIFPASGDTFQYIGAGQTIQLRWTGAAEQAYTIEYEIGKGAYHLEGRLEVTSNTPSYGPYHADFWNSLVLYNPWRFRVFSQGQPHAGSEWVSFDLAPSTDGGWSVAGSFLLFTLAVGQTAAELFNLARGLVLGSVDLALWLSGIPAADVTAWALLFAIAAALIWPRLQVFGEDRVRAWGIALAYVVFVYATVPVFPTLWTRLQGHAGAKGAAHLGTVIVGGLALLLAYHALRRAREGGLLWRVPAIAVVLGLYVWLLAAFGTFPAERLHLLEYGFMAFLVHRALAPDMESTSAYASAVVLTSLLGFGDETIQWVLPQRFFELKDVALNVAAASLGLALIALAKGGRGQR
jgi:choline-sulfatase